MSDEFTKIRTLAELEKENLSLKRENVALHKTVDKLLKEMQKKSEEHASLMTMVSATIPAVKSPETKVPVITPEAEIAENQLERLRSAAKVRLLTLEETRQFDMYVKNKRLSHDESTINLSKNQYRDVKEADLIKLIEKASTPDESDNK